jgi:hypothetical protein
MAQAAFPGASTLMAAVPRLPGSVCVLVSLLLVVGCASQHPDLPGLPEVTQGAVAARVLLPPDLNVNPAETVVKPGTPGQASSGPPAACGPGIGSTTLALPDAIAFALQNNPRLRSARAAIERARGQEQVAFAPFLPQVDLLGQYGVTSATFAPGVPRERGVHSAEHLWDPELRAN